MMVMIDKLAPQTAGDALEYLEACGALDALNRAGRSEMPADQAVDVAFLHKFVRKKKPSIILELGCGHSTVVMAHAAHSNAEEFARDPSAIYSVDAHRQWLDSLAQNFPEHLRQYVDLRFSTASIKEIAGQLCHAYDELPDITPSLIYIDGPNPDDVLGSINGLSFAKTRGLSKRAVSADVLLYEWILPRGVRVIVDGRRNNIRFLQKNFRRQWDLEVSDDEGRAIFTLVD